MNKRNRFGAIIGLSLAMAGAPSMATPSLVNGGFETGTFSGWTQFGMDLFDVVTCASPSALVYQGNCAASFAAFGETSGIEQLVTGLTVGETYRIDFAFQADGSAPSSFEATIGSSILMSLVNPVGQGYGQYSFLRTAISESETLRFTFRNDPGFMFLDAVTVAVPEPSALVLASIGIGVLAVSRRRSPAVMSDSSNASLPRS